MCSLHSPSPHLSNNDVVGHYLRYIYYNGNKKKYFYFSILDKAIYIVPFSIDQLFYSCTNKWHKYMFYQCIIIIIIITIIIIMCGMHVNNKLFSNGIFAYNGVRIIGNIFLWWNFLTWVLPNDYGYDIFRLIEKEKKYLIKTLLKKKIKHVFMNCHNDY